MGPATVTAIGIALDWVGGLGLGLWLESWVF